MKRIIITLAVIAASSSAFASSAFLERGRAAYEAMSPSQQAVIQSAVIKGESIRIDRSGNFYSGPQVVEELKPEPVSGDAKPETQSKGKRKADK
jgi:hypothetical protein